jgi:hypothetical protein
MYSEHLNSSTLTTKPFTIQSTFDIRTILVFELAI